MNSAHASSNSKIFSMSVLNQQVELMIHPLGAIINNMLKNFPQLPDTNHLKEKEIKLAYEKYEETVDDYLKINFVFSDPQIINIITSIAETSHYSPVDSYKEFISLLPCLSYTGDSKVKNPPTSILKMPLTQYCHGLDKMNEYQRYGFIFIFDCLKCLFTQKLLASAERTNDFTKIFEEIMQMFYPSNTNDEIPDSYERIRTNLVIEWSKCICVLSDVASAAVTKTMVKQLHEIGKSCEIQRCTPIQLTKFFTLFQNFIIKPDVKDEIGSKSRIIAPILKYLKGVKVDSQLHISSMHFFTNLCGNLFNNNKEYYKSDFLKEMSDFAASFQKNKKYTGPAYILRAQVYIFSRHKDLKNTIPQYASKYVKDLTQEGAANHLASLCILLRGRHYAPEGLLELYHENYKWWQDHEHRELPDIVFDVIKNYPGAMVHAQSELTSLLLQLASMDFAKFVNNYLPALLSQAVFGPNQLAIYNTVREILTPLSKFAQYANSGNDSSLMKKFADSIFPAIQGEIKGLPTSGIAGMYKTTSFIESLNLTPNIKAYENIENAIYEACVRDLLHTSAAQPMPDVSARHFTGSLKNAWGALVAKYYTKEIFESLNETKVERAAIPDFEVDKSLAAISLVPYLRKVDFIQILVPLLMSSLPHVSSLALRVVQATIVLFPDSLDDAVVAICGGPIPRTLAGLCMQVQGLTDILRAGVWAHSKLPEKTMQKVFNCVISGIASPSFEIRNLSLELAEVADRIGEVRPSFAGFLRQYGTKVAEELQRLVISVGSYKSLDLTKLDKITFQAAAAGSSDSLYMCALSVVGRTMSNAEDFKYAIERAIPDLIAIAKAAKEMNPLFGINMYVFVSACTSDNVVGDAMKLLTKVAPNRILPCISLYTALVPEIGKHVLDSVDLDDSFQAHIVSFTIRNLLDISKEHTPYVLEKAQLIVKSAIAKKAFPGIPNFKFVDGGFASDIHLIYALADCTLVFKVIYSEMFAKSSAEPHGPFPRSLVYEGDAVSGDAANQTFAFLVNASCLNAKEPFVELSGVAKEALNEFSRMYQLPDHEFANLSKNLDIVSEISINVLSSLLTSSYVNLLNLYVNQAATKPAFLEAIANQFAKVVDLEQYLRKFESNASAEMTKQEREFASTIESVCGNLISLAFFYLASSDAMFRQLGLRILVGVALPEILMTAPNADVTLLARKIGRLHRQDITLHPEISENLLVQIAECIHELLPIVSEQVISEAFHILSVNESNAVFMKIIVPFVYGSTFNRAEAGLNANTPDRFVRFTGYTLLKQFVRDGVSLPLNRGHFTFIDALLAQPCEDLSTLEFFLICVYSIQERLQLAAEKALAVLKYVFTTAETEVISHITKYLMIKGWFYHQIQLLRMDMQFDVNRFLDDMQDMADKAANDDDEEESTNNDQALYDLNVTFTIKLMLLIVSENPNALSTQVEYIVLFCIIYYSEFEGLPAQLLETILRSAGEANLITLASEVCSSRRFPNISSASDFTEGVIGLSQRAGIKPEVATNAIKYIIELPTTKFHNLCDEALRWGVACGELNIAYHALAIYYLLMTSASEDSVRSVIRTIKVIGDILHERTDPAFRVQKSQWIIAIMDRPKIDFALPYQYMALLVRVLDKSNQLLRTPLKESFEVATQILDCNFVDQMAIFAAAVNLIHNSLKVPSFAGSIGNIDIIREIFNANHTPQSLAASVDFLMFACDKMLFDVINTPAYPIQSLVLGILPYIWARRYQPQTQSAIRSVIQAIPQSGRLFENMGGQLQNCLPQIVAEFMKAITDSEAILRLVHFITSIVANTQDQEIAAAVFVIARAMIGVVMERVEQKQLSLSADIFGEIGMRAINNTDTSSNIDKLAFLTALKHAGGTVKAIGLPGNKQFPSLSVPIPAWRIGEAEDPLVTIGSLPPMSLIDIDYNGLEALKPIQAAVQAVKVSPFTEWSNAVFRAEAIQVEDQGVLAKGSVEVPPVQAFFDCFNRGVLQEDTDDVPESRRRAKPTRGKSGDTSGNANSDVVGKDTAAYSTVPKKSFFPSSDEMKMLGADLLGGIELPDFFK